MKVFKLNPNAANIHSPCCLSIGNFDGVHLGHQYLFAQLKALEAPRIVLLFEPQAKEFFLKEHAPLRLDGLREKLWHLKNIGLDYVVLLRFNQSIADIDPRDFVEQVLLPFFHIKTLVLGHDFRFGKQRQGDFSLMQLLGRQYGFDVIQVQAMIKDACRVSSSKIRECLVQQDLTQALSYLGHEYVLFGRVQQGKALARAWGVPTANMHLKRQNFALNGVFCVKIRICETAEEYYGVANVGTRPSLDGQVKVCEVHIFDFNRFIYGQMLSVSFIKFLRPEQRFADLGDLRQQIYRDVAAAKAYFLEYY